MIGQTGKDVLGEAVPQFKETVGEGTSKVIGTGAGGGV